MQSESGTRYLPSRIMCEMLKRWHAFAQVGLLSWNVGGISDHRKDQGAGLEEARFLHFFRQ